MFEKYIIPLFSTLLEKANNNYFISFRLREKKSSYVKSKPNSLYKYDDIAIVIQGPVIKKNNFTIETLKIYKYRYPNIKLILSTWDNTEIKLINEINKLDIYLILNKKPKYNGISNINLQIKTTKYGIFKAVELGCKYCLKTRTDQRIYRFDFIQYLISLTDIFTPSENIGLNKRLISISLNTYKYRLYGISDMFMFGDINDMLKYWSVEYDKRLITDVQEGFLLEDWAKAKLCEVYLSTEFANKIKFNLEWTIYNSWKFYRDYFCIIDRESIDIYWQKYNRFNENRTYTNTQRHVKEEFMFSDWINCYNNYSLYTTFDESFLKLKQQ